MHSDTLMVEIGEPSIHRYGLETQGSKDQAWVTQMGVIDMRLSTFEAIPMAVTIGGGVVDKGRVITKTYWEIFVLVGAHLNKVFIYELINYELSL